jgi:hypothetical protein
MDIQPVKKYKSPAYPTLTQAKTRGLKADGAVALSGRHKALVAAAAVVLSGTLSSCIPIRTAGMPVEPPPSYTEAPGVSPARYSTGEHDVHSALKEAASASLQQAAPALAKKELQPNTPVDADDAWNEEPDLQAAFDEFLAWMRSEGVV